MALDYPSGLSEPGPPTRRLAATFRDKRTERAFREWTWDDTVRQVRIGLVLAALGFAGFIAADWQLFGGTDPFRALLIARLALLVVLVATFAVSTQGVRPVWLDAMAITSVACTFGVMCMIIAFYPPDYPIGGLALVLIVGAYLYFYYNRLVAMGATILAGSIGCAATAWACGAADRLFETALPYLIANLVCFSAAHRLNTLRRHEFASQRAQRRLNADLAREIADRQQADVALRERAAADGLLGSFARRFLTSDHERAMGYVLAGIGHFTEADRALLMTIDDARNVWCTQEWVRPRVAPLRDRLQGVSIADADQLLEPWMQGEPAVLSEPDSLPAGSGTSQWLIGMGMGSLLATPLLRQNRLVGALAVAGNNPRTWSDAARRLLRRSGDVLTIAEQQQRTAEALEQSERQYRHLVEGADNVILRWTADGTIRFANSFGQRFFGMPASALIGRNLLGSLLQTDTPHGATSDTIVEAIRAGRGAEALSETRHERADDGEEVWLAWTNRAIEDDKGGLVEILSVAYDITDRKRLEDELRRLATTDALTAVANRRHFMELAAVEVSRSLRYHRPLAVLMIDVDHFKSINDARGHDVGDDALRHLSAVCKETLRTNDVIGRLGGEEFAVLLPETDRDGGRLVAERLRDAIGTSPVRPAAGEPLTITVSVGMARLTPDDVGIETVLKRADEALYAAKSGGRNRVVDSGVPGGS